MNQVKNKKSEKKEASYTPPKIKRYGSFSLVIRGDGTGQADGQTGFELD